MAKSDANAFALSFIIRERLLSLYCAIGPAIIFFLGLIMVVRADSPQNSNEAYFAIFSSGVLIMIGAIVGYVWIIVRHIRKDVLPTVIKNQQIRQKQEFSTHTKITGITIVFLSAMVLAFAAYWFGETGFYYVDVVLSLLFIILLVQKNGVK